MKIAVLGANGMLGSALVDYLSREFEIVATVKRRNLIKQIPHTQWHLYDVLHNTNEDLLNIAKDCDWIINAVGLINKRQERDVWFYSINAFFPSRLAMVAEKCGIPVIQIATDCVFSGGYGNYIESDVADAEDVYGKSKAMGEIQHPYIHHLRTSIVGMENGRQPVSLLGWFLSQPQGAIVNGWANHYWNGITTLAFAKICQGIIESQHKDLPSCQHIVPADSVNKYELLAYFRHCFGREDISIIKTDADKGIDRNLLTDNWSLNELLWKMAGYKIIPTIEELIKELAEYNV